MNRLLNLIPRYRRLRLTCDALRARSRKQRSAIDLMAGELTAMRRENESLRGMVESANKEARNAIATLANVGFQLRFGSKMYPDAPGIPERSEQVELPTPQNRIPLPFERRMDKKRRFVEQTLERYDQTHGDPDQSTVDVVA